MKTKWFLTAGAVALAFALSTLPAAAHCGSCASDTEAAAKTCASGSPCADKADCGEATGECAGACADKCGKTAASETVASANVDCAACAPIAAVLGNDRDARVDIVNLEHGAVMIVVASRPESIRAIQAASASGGDRSSAATADGLCGNCSRLGDLREAGITTRTELISSGTLFVFTGQDRAQIAGIRSWADGLRQSLAQKTVAADVPVETLASSAL